jgi:hypothetical protein
MYFPFDFVLDESLDKQQRSMYTTMNNEQQIADYQVNTNENTLTVHVTSSISVRFVSFVFF